MSKVKEDEKLSAYLDEPKGGKVYRYEENQNCKFDGDTLDVYRYRYEVYLTENIVRASSYSGLCSLLRESKAYDEFNFYLANYGGYCHSLINLVSAIYDSRSTVNMHVVAPCYSAASTLALCGDSLDLRPYTFLMFHNYSATKSGKGQELIDEMVASDSWIKDYMSHLHKPFLSQGECQKIENDKDVRIFYNDKDLEHRIKRHFK